MAYLKLGLSREQLERRFQDESSGGLSEAELVARFGRNPERFLLDADASDPLRSAFGYNELKSALLRDSRGREYSRHSDAHPDWAYVTIPKSITLAQRRASREELAYDDVVEFPLVGEDLVLTVIGASRPESAPVYRTAVLDVIMRRSASALLRLSDALPSASDVPDSRVGRRDEAAEVRAALRKRGLLPEQQQQDEDERARKYPDDALLRLRFPSVEAADGLAARRKRPGLQAARISASPLVPKMRGIRAASKARK
jgi:hypothetical protein